MLHHKERNLWGCQHSQCVEYAWVSLRHARREAEIALSGGRALAVSGGQGTPTRPWLSAHTPVKVATKAPDARFGGGSATIIDSMSSSMAIGDPPGLDALLKLLDASLDSTSAGVSSQPHLYLVVQTMHGLGNRLRALCSAFVMAKTLGRRLAIVWEPDIHCNVSFHQLFEPLDGVPVFGSIGSASGGLNRLEAHRAVTVLKWTGHKHRLMSAEQRTANERRHIFVQASFNLVSPYQQLGLPATKPARGPWHEIKKQSAEMNLACRRLKPVDAVQDMLRRFRAAAVGSAPQGRAEGSAAPNINARLLGVHVRAEANLTVDIPSIGKHSHQSSINEEAMEPPKVAEARQRCSWNAFVRPAVELLAGGSLANLAKPTVVYIASDQIETVASLCTALAQNRRSGMGRAGARCVGAPLEERRQCDGSMRRGVYCQQQGLAELLLLAEACAFLYSDYSSFSEMVGYFAPPGSQQITRNGCPPPPPTS